MSFCIVLNCIVPQLYLIIQPPVHARYVGDT
jgi:hypothetical protein